MDMNNTLNDMVDSRPKDPLTLTEGKMVSEESTSQMINLCYINR